MNAKRFISYAALLAGVLIFNGHLNAAVESEVVGYTTIEMEAGKWYQVGCPFEALQDGATLNEVFSSGFGDGDLMYLYDATSNTYSKVYRWRTSAAGSGWHTKPMGSEMATDVLTHGSAVFVSKAVTGTVCFSGSVNEAATVPLGSESGNAWNQVVYPYPEAVSLKDMTWTGLEVGDTLYIYDSDVSTYTKIYRWRTSSSGTGWHTKPMGSEMATDVIEPGMALFVNKVSLGTGSLGK